jgi:hypothetical protein
MLIEAILAAAFLLDPAQKPEPIASYETLSACLADAENLNKTVEKLREPEFRKAGAEYVCLVIKRAGVI